MDKAKGGRPTETPTRAGGVSLSNLGISHNQSSQWQKLAKVPNDSFEQAAALAMIYPEPEKGGRGKLSGFRDSLGVSSGYARNLLSQARSVLRHSRALVEDVFANAKDFSALPQSAGARGTLFR